ncbi:MAG: hypothetical protein HWN81_00265 [Candidatus Lokiarchaeota archaeon]|nr:hypothetical protein [Candidatus Lokiarchaeota archaeon]
MGDLVSKWKLRHVCPKCHKTYRMHNGFNLNLYMCPSCGTRLSNFVPLRRRFYSKQVMRKFLFIKYCSHIEYKIEFHSNDLQQLESITGITFKRFKFLKEEK